MFQCPPGMWTKCLSNGSFLFLAVCRLHLQVDLSFSRTACDCELWKSLSLQKKMLLFIEGWHNVKMNYLITALLSFSSIYIFIRMHLRQIYVTYTKEKKCISFWLPGAAGNSLVKLLTSIVTISDYRSLENSRQGRFYRFSFLFIYFTGKMCYKSNSFLTFIVCFVSFMAKMNE